MKLVRKILKYEIHNTIRSKWVLLYSIFFFAVGYSLFSFSGDVNKAYISLMNIIIIVIPLVSLIFGSIYFYNSREFIEMMLSQPIDRKSLFTGIYLGTSLPLSAGFVIGISLPFILFGKLSQQIEGIAVLLIVGAALTFIFNEVQYLRFNGLHGRSVPAVFWELPWDSDLIILPACLDNYSFSAQQIFFQKKGFLSRIYETLV